MQSLKYRSRAFLSVEIKWHQQWNKFLAVYNGSLTQGDIVTCTYSDYSLCISSGFVNSNPIIISGGTTQPASISIAGPAGGICSGTAATFFATTSNAGFTPVFDWRINGVSTVQTIAGLSHQA